MKTNMCRGDMGLRILVGAILIALAISGVVGAWGYIGILPLVSGLMRYCPAYALLNKMGCCKNK